MQNKDIMMVISINKIYLVIPILRVHALYTKETELSKLPDNFLKHGKECSTYTENKFCVITLFFFFFPILEDR